MTLIRMVWAVCRAMPLSVISYTASSNKLRGCIQKFPDWHPGASTANNTAVTSCSCIAILWVSLVRFVAITLCVASQRVFIIIIIIIVIIIIVYFVIDSVRKLLVTPSYYSNLTQKTWTWIFTAVKVSNLRSSDFKCSECNFQHLKYRIWGI
jgi:hypothetical protein